MPDTDPLKDISDDEIDAATDKVEYDKKIAEGGEGAIGDASDAEIAEGLNEILPDSEKISPLEKLSDSEVVGAAADVEAALEVNPDKRLLDAAGATARNIDSTFASGKTGDARDTALDDARDAFFKDAKLEGKSAKEVMETADVLRGQIIEIGETYRSQMKTLQEPAEALKSQAENKKKEIPIYRTVGNEALATEREKESADLEKQAGESTLANKKEIDNLNSKAQELMAFAANKLESDELLDSVPSDALDQFTEQLSVLKPESLEEFAPIVAQGVKAIELELIARADQGEFSKDKVQTLLDNMQRRLQKNSDERSKKFIAQHDKPTEGEEEFAASDDDIDALFG